jgi:hypothetical protein
MIPLFGIPAICVALTLFAVVYPAYFDGNLPSISRTISHPPSSTVFQAFMVPTVSAIIFSWLYLAYVNVLRLCALPRRGWSFILLLLLNGASSGLGAISGLSLLALSFVTLVTDNYGHMVLSFVFFISQISTFLLDSLFTALMDRRETSGMACATVVRRNLRYKTRVAFIICGLGILYYLLFLAKDVELAHGNMLVKTVYVANEYLLCILLFSYSVFYVPLGVRAARKVQHASVKLEAVPLAAGPKSHISSASHRS